MMTCIRLCQLNSDLIVRISSKHDNESVQQPVEKDDPWSSINIIRDLTKAQLKEEKEMRTEVEKRNSEITEEEKGN